MASQMGERPLRKEQERKFMYLFLKLREWTEKQRPDDYCELPVHGDGHFLGDQIDKRIEFVKGGMIYTIVLTARQEDN